MSHVPALIYGAAAGLLIAAGLLRLMATEVAS